MTAIDVNSLTPGVYAPNSFPGFSSPQTQVVNQNGYWGQPAGTRFLMATNPSQCLLKSIDTPRDVEITTWISRGCIYLRYANGRALYFQPGPVASNTWEIGVCINIVEPSISGAPRLAGDYYALGQGTYDPPVYPNAGTDTFTVGASGHDIYLKRNGIEIFRTQQLYQMVHGQVTFYSSGDGIYGFTNITMAELPEVQLYSDYVNNVWDPRDWGWKDLTAVGLIAAGSNKLGLVSNPGFAAGDKIILENTPRALIASVTAVDGNTLALNKIAFADVADANVYYDCTQAYRAVLTDRFPLWFLLPSNVKVALPAGKFAVADWDLGQVPTNPTRNGWEIYGQGKDATSLFNPLGCAATPLTFSGVNLLVRDFEYIGNITDVDQVVPPSVGSAEQHGIVFMSSSNCTMQDLRVVNVLAKYCGTAYSDHCAIRRCYGVQEKYWTRYEGWMFQCSDSNHITFDSNDARCLKGGSALYESFRGSDNKFTNNYGRNGIASNNTSPRNVWDGNTFEFDDGVGDFLLGSGLSPYSPAWQTNDNLGGGTSDACIVRNQTIIVHGYTWNNATLVAAGVYGAASNPNMKGLITGIDIGDDNCQVIADPPWASRPKDAPLTGGIYVTEQPYAGWGGQGVRNDTAKGVVVDGFRCLTFGQYDWWSGQINNNGPGAVVKNSVADQIVVNSGNVTQAQFAAK